MVAAQTRRWRLIGLCLRVSVEPPSAPRSIVPQMNDSTLSLEWSEPLESGGRADLSYSVGCTLCKASSAACLSCGDSVSYRPAQHGLVERRVEVWGLLPHTTYIFTVQTINGVSHLSGKEPASKSINITTTHDGKRQEACVLGGGGLFFLIIRSTDVGSAVCAVPSLVSLIQRMDSTESSLTLHWSVPDQPRYTILRYQIRYCEKVRAAWQRIHTLSRPADAHVCVVLLV